MRCAGKHSRWLTEGGNEGTLLLISEADRAGQSEESLRGRRQRHCRPQWRGEDIKGDLAQTAQRNGRSSVGRERMYERDVYFGKGVNNEGERAAADTLDLLFDVLPGTCVLLCIILILKSFRF